MLRSTCLIMLIFAGVAAADVQTGVVRSGGVAIPGATVSAECGSTDKITTTADDAGRFEMGGLPSTSCKYTVLMFGFEPLQKDAAASSTPLTFDLTLQGHATEPVAPKPVAPVVTSNQPNPATPVTPPPAAAPPAPTTPDAPPPSMIAAQNAANAPRGARGARGATGATGATGRGGRGGTQAQNGRGGRGGANAGGFQNLSLVQNEDAPAASDAPASVLGNVDSGVATGDSFTVNGTLSQGVQAQAGDGMGMGGAGGFGFGAGGPGGGAFGADGLGGPGGDQAGAPGGRGGGRGGAGGPGGPDAAAVARQASQPAAASAAVAVDAAVAVVADVAAVPVDGADVAPTEPRPSAIAPVADAVRSGRPLSVTTSRTRLSMRGLTISRQRRRAALRPRSRQPQITSSASRSAAPS